jgi:hypothetical protein
MQEDDLISSGSELSEHEPVEEEDELDDDSDDNLIEEEEEEDELDELVFNLFYTAGLSLL